MTLKHTFQSTSIEASTSGASGGNGIVGPAEWNADHIVTVPTNAVLYSTGGSVSGSSGLTFLSSSATLATGQTSSFVNGLQFSGEVSGTAPMIKAVGSDTNVGLQIYPQGTGAAASIEVTSLSSITGIIQLTPVMTAGADNPIVQANDCAIIFSQNSQNTGALVIAPWSNTGGGMRLDSSGNVSFYAAIISTGIPTSNPHVNGQLWSNANVITLSTG